MATRGARISPSLGMRSYSQSLVAFLGSVGDREWVVLPSDDTSFS